MRCSGSFCKHDKLRLLQQLTKNAVQLSAVWQMYDSKCIIGMGKSKAINIHTFDPSGTHGILQ
jgi:hypothetical protein